MLLLPIIALVVSRAAGLLYVDLRVILLASVACIGMDHVRYQWIVRTFNRVYMVTRLT